jgi:hypothetical protein
MSQTTPAGPGPHATPEEIEAHLAATRARLADRVDALADKVDVKTRAQDKVEDVKVAAQARAEEGREKVLAGSRQVTDRYQGLPRPAQIAIAVAPVVLMVVLVIRKIRS